MDAVVVNTTDGDLEWAVETDVEGEINNLWNAERSADSGRVRFTGVRWNATIGAGQRAEFGWCARL
jgi:cellulase/cellobiase CelA1